MQIKDIIQELERIAPLAYQESYDNAGLIVGNPNTEVESALVALDVTETVIDEAIEAGHKLLIVHHPILFKGLKKINGQGEEQRCLIKAIKHDIAIYASHTNLDSVKQGVNDKICDKIGLSQRSILSPAKNQLVKLSVFVPKAHLEQVQQAIFTAGAGAIGDYDSCGFVSSGTGSFRAREGAKPFVGKQGELHYEQEVRLESILPKHKQSAVVLALKANHPYEEVAYDIYPLDNANEHVGIGMIGELENAMPEKDLLAKLKETFGCEVIRHSSLLGKPIKRVAVCGGAGSFLISTAMRAQADVFITGDMKYHDFFEADNRILLADIGHFESEQYTQEIISEILSKKFPNFVVQLTAHNTNSVKYFI